MANPPLLTTPAGPRQPIVDSRLQMTVTNAAGIVYNRVDCAKSPHSLHSGGLNGRSTRKRIEHAATPCIFHRCGGAPASQTDAGRRIPAFFEVRIRRRSSGAHYRARSGTARSFLGEPVRHA